MLHQSSAQSSTYHETHAQFLDCLFLTGTVEIRAIETWKEHGQKQSRLIERLWLSPTEVVQRFAYLKRLNRAYDANIYFGVNERNTAGYGTKRHVAQCKSVWMDFDLIRAAELPHRLPSHLKTPNLVVDSGHGIHAYFLLDEPFDVSTDTNREAFENMLRNLYKAVGADATCDVSRLLRLPGFLNVKDARNGREPVLCTLLHCDPSRTFSIDLFFDSWGKHREGKEVPDLTQGMVNFAGTELSNGRRAKRVRSLVRYLERSVDDRSRRDFGVVCGLFRAGLTMGQVRDLVQGCSKFANNKQYLETTLLNAQKAVMNREL
jgi:hypothetical protein